MTSGFRLREAARLIHRGGVVACPTEAVYGLSCDPLDPRAVMHLLRLKRRPVEKGLILLAAHIEQLRPFALLEGDWMEPVLASWPGPATWLLPARPDLPYWINGGRDTVACRVTAHPLAAALCDAAGQALISTSANRAGRPPARSPVQVRLRCPGADAILCGKLGHLERPTPIRDPRSGAQVR
jgi:L-threonylcarbamoyladenylate synthase